MNFAGHFIGVLVQGHAHAVSVVFPLLFLEQTLAVEELDLRNWVFLEDAGVDFVGAVGDDHQLLLGSAGEAVLLVYYVGPVSVGEIRAAVFIGYFLD